MMKRDFKGWRVLATCLALACVTATASAQNPAPIPGMAADGSITADGVTFTAEDLQAMVDSYRVNPAGLPADLPSAVRAAVYTLAAVTAATPPPFVAPEGGQP